MHCSICRREIPCSGTICPCCPSGRSAVQRLCAAITIGLTLGGGIGWLIGPKAMLACALGGGVLGAALGTRHLPADRPNADQPSPPDGRKHLHSIP